MKRAIRIIALVLVFGLIFALILFNMNAPKNHSDTVWDERATLGAMDAENYYVMITDLACPYCDAFSRVVTEHKGELISDYIEGKSILYEVRVTDFLYEYGEHKTEMSRWSAEGAYCATRQGKFWEYYEAALSALYRDYHSKGIGVSKTSPEITDMTFEYWVRLGEEVGLGSLADFETCMNEHQTVAEIEANTAKAAALVQGGLPYYKFGKFTTSGFDQSWGWDYVKRYFDAGL